MATFLTGMIQNAQGLNQLLAQKDERERRTQQFRDIQDASGLLKQYQQSVKAGNPNQEILIEATLKSPDLAEQVLGAMGVTDKAQLQQAAADSAELWQLKDNPQMFMGKLAQRANAIAERGGDPVDTIELAKLYAQDPEQAVMRLKSGAAALEAKGYKTGVFDGGNGREIGSIQELEQYKKLLVEDPALAEKYGKKTGLIESGREEAATPQEKNFKKYQQLISEGKQEEAEMFGRSAGLLSKEGQVLSAQAQTSLQKAMDDSESNAVNVTKYIDLADRFAGSDIAGGLLGKGGNWRESIKSVFGMQDEDVTKLVSDWQKIRSGEAINSLPPGPATDADIRIAQKPLPENANKEYMDKYLRGLAKMAEYKQRYNQAKADFISENGSLRDKSGKNFGSYWKDLRQSVMDNIKEDPRFKIDTEQRKRNFLGDGAQPQQKAPRIIGRFEIVEEGE